jgi:hypothetical protein
MKKDEFEGTVTAVAFEVFESFNFFGDEAVFDIRRAIEVIQTYGDERVREALGPRRGTVVQLRMVRRA